MSGMAHRVAPRWLLVAATLLVALSAPAQTPDSSIGSGEAGEPKGQVVERGPVRATVRVSPESVKIGDPVTLHITVTAEDGVEVLMPSFGDSLERFAILDFAPQQRLDEQGRQVYEQAYRLLAQSSGKHAVPPIMIEFIDRRPGNPAAPEGEDAYELLTERVGFEVASVVPADAGDGLKPPLGALSERASEDPTDWRFIASVATIGLVAAGLALVLWLRAAKRHRVRSAYEIAMERALALQARGRPRADDREAMDQFFVELSDLVRHYLEDRFSLHAPELTTEEFLDVASASPDLTADHRRLLQQFLARADQVKFARLLPSIDDVEVTLSAMLGFLEQTKEPAAGEARAGPGNKSGGSTGNSTGPRPAHA